jgi:CBS-domain-containing membrane protein
MKAVDVMTKNVAAVSPDATIVEMAKKMVAYRISALPVIGAGGAVVGIVSEGDLFRRTEIGTARRSSWWLNLLSSNQSLAEEYARVHGRLARDVMSTDVISVTEETEVGEIAQLLDDHSIKRVPVLRNGKLVGIVSRGDLVAALAGAAEIASRSPTQADEKLREALLRELRQQPWTNLEALKVSVRHGIVRLRGTVASDEEKRALVAAAESVRGAKGVRDQTVVAPISVVAPPF